MFLDRGDDGAGERASEIGQNGNAVFQYRQLGNSERRVRRNMGADERGDVPGRSYSATFCALMEDAKVPRPQSYRDPIGRW